jgi:class 3 adenylate cyclase
MVDTSDLPRGTVTFLFTDIEGSTDLVRELGEAFGRIRSEHRRILREAFARHRGHEIDTAGDGFFVAFERAADAVASAVESQRALQAPLRVRMGLHTAEPYLDEAGYTGVGVHRAARICAAGHGGQVLVSNATAGIIEDLRLKGVSLRDLGEFSLKDLEGPQRLFQVVVEGLQTEFPPLKTVEADRARPAIVTLLVTDVAGWGRVLPVLGDEVAGVTARAYHDLAIAAATTHNGRVFDLAGDTTLVMFDRPHDALRAAVELRTALRTEPWFPDDTPPEVAMAIHSGRLVDPTSRHLGTVAFRCISLCDTAQPGQILVSHTTEALLEGEGAGAVVLRHLGERSLPNLDRPMNVYEVAG